MKGDNIEITLSANIREDKYIAFGLSGVNNKAQMVSNSKNPNYTFIRLKTYTKGSGTICTLLLLEIIKGSSKIIYVKNKISD